MADPWIVGNFYQGSEFIRRGDLSPTTRDSSIAVLIDIEPSPEYSVFALRQTPLDNAFGDLSVRYYKVQGGTIVHATTITGVIGSVPKILSSYPPPYFLIFTDENGDFRYVYPDASTGALTVTGTYLSQFIEEQGWFIGESIKMAGTVFGTSLYDVTVNSSNQVIVTLDTINTLRSANLHISGGHKKPYQASTNTLWLNYLDDFEGVTSGLNQLDTGFGGLSISQSGGLRIHRDDGRFDFLANQPIIDREITARAGLNTDPIASYKIISKGIALTAETNLDYIDITFKDKGIYFDQFIQENAFLGTGGAEGLSELAGVLKPLALGFILHGSPLLIDSVNQIYFLHDGTIYSSPEPIVYEGALLRNNFGHYDLTSFLAWEPTTNEAESGGFIWHNGSGGKGAMIKLANIPQKKITVRFFGDNTITPLEGSGDSIIRFLINRIKGITIDIDNNSFSDFSNDYPYGTGIYIKDQTRIRDVVNQILEPIGAYGHLDSINNFTIGKVKRKVPKAIITPREWQDTGNPVKKPGPGSARIYRIGHTKCWSVFDDSDFLGAIDENLTLKGLLQKEYRYHVVNSYDDGFLISSRNRAVNSVEYNTLLTSSSNALRIANALLMRDISMTEIIEVSIRGYPYQFNICDTLLLDIDEYDTNFPRLYIIIDKSEHSVLGLKSFDEGQTDLVLWG